MGKPKKSNANNNHGQKVPVSNYGTHSVDVVKIGTVNINQINDDAFGQTPIIVAKDGTGLYVTSKRHIDSGLLDPYKTYNRENYTVVENKSDETDDVFYTITNIKMNKSITI